MLDLDGAVSPLVLVGCSMLDLMSSAALVAGIVAALAAPQSAGVAIVFNLAFAIMTVSLAIYEWRKKRDAGQTE